MAHKYSTIFKWIHVIADFVLLNATLSIPFVMADHDHIRLDEYGYKLTVLLMNFCWFYCSGIFGIYQQVLKRDAGPIMTANIGTLMVFVLMVFLIKLGLPYLYIPPAPLIYYFALFPVFLLVWKLMFLFMRMHKRRFWPSSNKIAIVGAGNVGLDFYNYINSNPHLGYYTTGIFEDQSLKVPAYINYLGKVEECFAYAKAHQVNEIYCALPYKESARIELLMQEADQNMIRFRLIPDVQGSIHHNFLVELFGYVPILMPRQEPLENIANAIVKRIFDLLFSSAVIIFFLSWIFPIIALLIKLDSRGPVFFKQLRSGKNNKPFYCYKFRSMTINKESESVQASKGDARVTRLGRFMRKTSIDELPQFINVFLGAMSVVGPRPHMLKHTQDYSQLINKYMVRQFLTPGITGWAQINGFRGETKETTSMRNRVEADLWYLEHWSILLDLKIIILTLWQALKDNENAY